MPRTPLPRRLAVGLVATLAVVATACSTGSSSGGGATTSTTSYVDGAKARNLDAYLAALRTRGSVASAAVSGSAAARWAEFLRTLPLGASTTVEGQGDEYRICGPGQLPACSKLTAFQFDGNGLVQDLSVDGLPLSSRLRGQGINTNPTTGAIASVGLQWAYLRSDDVLYVVEQYWWSKEISPDTNGCDPARATYDRGGPVAEPSGGGAGSDPLGPWTLTAQFPDASLGGRMQLSCFRNDGSSEVFTETLPS